MRILLIGSVLVSGSLAWAEQSEGTGPPLTVGSYVRLRSSAASEPLRGFVTAVDEHALSLVTNRGLTRVPLDSITAAEARAERRGHAVKGLAIGGTSGLLAGSLVFPVDPRLCKDGEQNYYCSRGEAAAVGALAYGLIGAGIGALVKTERWARVDMRAGIEPDPAGLSPAAAPSPPGPGSPAASCGSLVGARPIVAGERVRVLAPATVSRGAIIGQLVVSDEATITIVRADHGGFGWPLRQAQARMLIVPRESVTRFERSVRPSRKRLGAGIAWGVGSVVALVIAESNTEGSCDQCGMAAGIIGSPAALLGYAVAPGERWAEEDPAKVCVAHWATEDPKDPRRVRFEIGPSRGGGVGVRLSVAF